MKSNTEKQQQQQIYVKTNNCHRPGKWKTDSNSFLGNLYATCGVFNNKNIKLELLCSYMYKYKLMFGLCMHVFHSVFAQKNDQPVFSHANITIHCNFFEFRRKIILHFLKWFSFTAHYTVYNTSIRYCFCCLICWNFQSFHPVMCPFMWVQNLANSLDISTFLVSANQH